MHLACLHGAGTKTGHVKLAAIIASTDCFVRPKPLQNRLCMTSVHAWDPPHVDTSEGIAARCLTVHTSHATAPRQR